MWYVRISIICCGKEEKVQYIDMTTAVEQLIHIQNISTHQEEFKSSANLEQF